MGLQSEHAVAEVTKIRGVVARTNGLNYIVSTWSLEPKTGSMENRKHYGTSLRDIIIDARIPKGDKKGEASSTEIVRCGKRHGFRPLDLARRLA